jgi:F-type H+-transporting ATPase subunit delta
MSNRKVARRYTLALYELSEELKLTQKVIKDFSDLIKSIKKSRELKLLLLTPIINSAKKEKILTALFKNKVHELTLKFIVLLTKKERENFLYDIANDFLDLVDEKQGIVKAKVKTAVKVPENYKKALTEKLSKYTGKEIRADFIVDSSIKGGFVAHVKDTILDASIQRQLELLREQFVKGSFNN